MAAISWLINRQSERSAREEAAKPVWQTVKSTPIRARCREKHALQGSLYTGTVDWLVETNSGHKRTFALLRQTQEESEAWLERSLNVILATPQAGELYRPPIAVELLSEGRHDWPRVGAVALSDNRPPYEVVCDSHMLQKE